jgi:hypothetical protein
MTEQPNSPDLGEGTDIDAAELDIDADRELPATSDETAYREEGETLGGTGGVDAGGAG